MKSQNPHITNLGFDKVEDNFEDDFKRKMVHKITFILKENGYSNITYHYYDENSYFFEGFTEAYQELRVDV